MRSEPQPHGQFPCRPLRPLGSYTPAQFSKALSTVPTPRPLQPLLLLLGRSPLPALSLSTEAGEVPAWAPAWLSGTHARACPETGAVRLLSLPQKSNLAPRGPFLSPGHKPVLSPGHIRGPACGCRSRNRGMRMTLHLGRRLPQEEPAHTTGPAWIPGRRLACPLRGTPGPETLRMVQRVDPSVSRLPQSTSPAPPILSPRP